MPRPRPQVKTFKPDMHQHGLIQLSFFQNLDHLGRMILDEIRNLSHREGVLPNQRIELHVIREGQVIHTDKFTLEGTIFFFSSVAHLMPVLQRGDTIEIGFLSTPPTPTPLLA